MATLIKRIRCENNVFVDSGGNMLSHELKKLMYDLENGVDNVEINTEAMLKELYELDEVEEIFQESLSLSDKVCPTCGRRL